MTPTPAAAQVVVDHTPQWLAWSSPIILALVAWALKKLDTIHTLVNSRLTAALDKIDSLEQRLQAVTGRIPTGEPPAPAVKPSDLIPRR